MTRLEHLLYQEELAFIGGLPIPWESLASAAVVISGATGMVGTQLIDTLMYKNKYDSLGCAIIALGRNASKAKNRFHEYWNNPHFQFLECDLNRERQLPIEHADYIIHGASNTNPAAYASNPIETITANITGAVNLLETARKTSARRFLFESTVEVFGQNRGDVDAFAESYCGYIDCNTLRAGYPEAKRTSEALCRAYEQQYGIDSVIIRFARIFGSTLLDTDTKALSQFIGNALRGEDIVLKSAGKQVFGFLYCADAVAALLYAMLLGDGGEAYNADGDDAPIMLCEAAQMIAGIAGVKCVRKEPEKNEAAGYSTANRAVMNCAKLHSIGWRPNYPLGDALLRTYTIKKDLLTDGFYKHSSTSV
jgi:nucleoside-diphosphate-sugar epimerase